MIIGLSGHKGCGKDTLAELLKPQGFVRVAFADTLKEAVALIFGLTADEMSDRTLKETPLTRWPYESPRQIMQKMGTEAMRTVWPDVWLMALKHRVGSHEKIVVTDVRFDNERDLVKQLGGVVVRITRHGCDGDQHASERGVEADFEIANDGSPEDMLVLLAQRLEMEYISRSE